MVEKQKQKNLKAKLYFKIFIYIYYIYTNPDNPLKHKLFTECFASLLQCWSFFSRDIFPALGGKEKSKKVHWKKKLCDRHPLHPFILVKALSVFLCFLWKRKRTTVCLEWLYLPFFFFQSKHIQLVNKNKVNSIFRTSTSKCSKDKCCMGGGKKLQFLPQTDWCLEFILQYWMWTSEAKIFFRINLHTML